MAKPVRLHWLVREIAHLHRAMAQVPIKVYVEPALETAVAFLDPVRVQQVL